MATQSNLGKLGILVGGGPAPGINGVISAATIAALRQGYEVIGFRDGYKWLAQGDTKHCLSLTEEDVVPIYNRGGSFLGTARTNPAKKEADMQNVLGIFKQLGVTALVSIGGDDTAYSASQVCRRAEGAIRVAHVPKTIDNDLPLPGTTPTFGFETARQIGTELVRNLTADAQTTSRWYLVVSMGRSAGHLALGIGKAAAATLTLIPEEFRGAQFSFDDLCDIIIGAVIKRKAAGFVHGMVVLAEGIVEAMTQESLAAVLEAGQGRYGRLTRDDHGNLCINEIEFGRLVKDMLASKLDAMDLRTGWIHKDIGYELRSADPVPFDVEYTRDLGHSAVRFIRSPDAEKYGAIIGFVEGKLLPLPFDNMLDPHTKRMQLRRVNVAGEGYASARAFMTRLEAEDLAASDRLSALATAAKMDSEKFCSRFKRAAGWGRK
jgi:6-phosphofructokinase 1